MNNDQLYLIAALSDANDENSLFALASKAAQSIGYEKILIGFEAKVPFRGPNVGIVSDYPEAWKIQYTKKNYVEKDLTVKHCRENLTPLVWGPETLSDNNQDFVDEAWSYNVRYGVSLGNRYGNHAKSMCSFVRDKPLNSSPQELQFMVSAAQILSQCIHVSLTRNVIPQLLRTGMPPLSPRELQCIAYVAAGKSSSVIADLIGVKEPTVAFHLKNVLRKLNVSTRLQAVSLVTALGLIE